MPTVRSTELAKQKSLTNPAGRKIPVNISLELRLMDLVDEEAFKLYGRVEGKRSETISSIIKDHFKIR